MRTLKLSITIYDIAVKKIAAYDDHVVVATLDLMSYVQSIFAVNKYAMTVIISDAKTMRLVCRQAGKEIQIERTKPVSYTLEDIASVMEANEYEEIQDREERRGVPRSKQTRRDLKRSTRMAAKAQADDLAREYARPNH